MCVILALFLDNISSVSSSHNLQNLPPFSAVLLLL